MAFRELYEGLRKTLPTGASERYAKLEALGRMYDGTLYDHLRWSFDQERYGSTNILMRERRPSVDFNLAFEITQDTMSELFGDEQQPTVNVMVNGEQDEVATEEMAQMLDEYDLFHVCSEAYEQGVIGSCAVVIHSDNGRPFYEVLPGKWCKPVYHGKWSNQLIALIVTYPVDKDQVEREFPEIVKESPDLTYWYRYIVGPSEIVDYLPMSNKRFEKIGQKDELGNLIEFKERGRTIHGFKGVVPAVFVKNFGGTTRDEDGMCLWWPIRNICIEIDYTLSQAGRGLRYTADPMLFVKRGDLYDQMEVPGGQDGRNMGNMASNTDARGAVRGATQVLVGGKDSDAKILETNANGINQEREFVKDLREYALEVLGGQKARAQQMSDSPSGRALDKGLKPLRRLVRRQRNPYGKGLLLRLVDLTVYGLTCGALEAANASFEVSAIPANSLNMLEWPKDEVLQGQDLFYHVQGLQLAAGGSNQHPKSLLSNDSVGSMLANDLGMHKPYASIKGTADDDDDLDVQQQEADIKTTLNPPKPPAPPGGPKK